MSEPSKEEIKRAEGFAQWMSGGVAAFSDPDAIKHWVWRLSELIAEVRAEGDREKAELVKEYQRLQDKGLEKLSKETPQDLVILKGADMAKILAEKSALEKRIRELEAEDESLKKVLFTCIPCNGTGKEVWHEGHDECDEDCTFTGAYRDCKFCNGTGDRDGRNG